MHSAAPNLPNVCLCDGMKAMAFLQPSPMEKHLGFPINSEFMGFWTDWKGSQVKIINTILRRQEDKEILEECTSKRHTPHISTRSFKSDFQAHTFTREGNWGTGWNNWTMLCSGGSNRIRSPASILHMSFRNLHAVVHMWNSKSLIERLCFPWSGIKWNTQARHSSRLTGLI